MFDFVLISLLCISLILNGVLVFYSIKVAKRLIIASANFEAIEDIFTSFETHLNSVHDSEMFYGDQTLQSLIEHSGLVLSEINKYRESDKFVFYDEYDEEDLRFEEKEKTEN